VKICWLNVRNSRNQIYQDFALRAATYKTVVVEQINLRQLARHPEEGEEQKPYAVQNASGRRQFAALSELLGRLARLTKESGSTLLDQPAPWTTRTCSKCGHKNETADLAQIYFTCESCKEEHDQDVNAARNMLASIGVSAVASNRQRGASDAAGERRAKGLATRRAGKSTIKTVVEPS
jgi:transposase